MFQEQFEDSRRTCLRPRTCNQPDESSSMIGSNARGHVGNGFGRIVGAGQFGAVGVVEAIRADRVVGPVSVRQFNLGRRTGHGTACSWGDSVTWLKSS